MGSSSRIRLGSKLLRVVDNRMGINGYSHRQRRAKPPNEEEEDTGSVWINRRSFAAAMSDRFLHATYARSPECLRVLFLITAATSATSSSLWQGRGVD